MIRPVDLTEITELLLQAREITRRITKCNQTIQMVDTTDIVAMRIGIFDHHFRDMSEEEKAFTVGLMVSQKTKFEDEIAQLNEKLKKLGCGEVDVLTAGNV